MGMHQRLAASQRHASDAAFHQPIQNADNLLHRQILAAIVRRGHEAVAAVVVTPSRDGPLHAVLVHGGIALVRLPGREGLRAVAWNGDAAFKEPLQQLFLGIRQAFRVDVVLSVEPVYQAVILPVEKVRVARIGIAQSEGKPLPPAQFKSIL